MKDYFNHIESYLKGQLSPEDQLAFEREMKLDESLSRAVENFPDAHHLAQHFIELETRKQLKVLKRQAIFRRILLWLVAVGVLVVLAFWILKNYPVEENINSTPDQIFASLYEPPASVFVRNEFELRSPADSAIYFFEQQKFQTSLDILLPLYQKDNSDVLILRYLSHSYLATQQWDPASRYLTKLYQTGNDPYASEALYHLLMIDLLHQRMEDARSKFVQIRNSSLISPSKLELLEKILSE